MNLRFIPAALALVAGLGIASQVQAAIGASATISVLAHPTSTTWQYGLSLHDTGTTAIGTFWFSWVPGEDFMASSPTGIVNPAGWSSSVTGGGGTDGYAILFTAGSGSSVASGGSLSTFAFTSTDTPASFSGNSVFYPTTPVGTSFVYAGQPFASEGTQFVVTSAATPEPATASVALGALALGAARRRRR